MNVALWLRLGFLMDLLPPVTWVPGSKSTYTRVRIRGASSEVTGRMDYIQSGLGGGTGTQNLVYAWDKTGNLTQRQNNTRA